MALFLGNGFGRTSAQDEIDLAASPVPPPPLPVFAIYPKDTGPRTFFQVTQAAGTTVNYTVVIANTGEKGSADFTGRAFAANVYIRTNGGLDTGAPDEAKSGATAWFEYSTDIVTLKPGTGIERTFAVVIPEETKPGEYVSALSFETAEPIEVPGTPNLKQILRQTIAFIITVPGTVVPSFSIDNLHLVVDPAWTGLEATLVNTGNVLVKPTGKITISDSSGKPLTSQDVVFGTFYAFKSGLIQTGFGNTLPAGDYQVTFELRDPETGATALIENQKITSVTQGELSAEAIPPINFDEATAEIKPALDNPQFLNVTAIVSNTGDPITGAELNIAAYHDGELVENYVLVSPLALPAGETNLSNRYIPAEGWSTGAWSFTLSVQVRDRETGVASILSTVNLGDPVLIP